MGFYQFGMEMVLSLNVSRLRNFFSTFYRLPFPLAHGFLSHRLSSAQLLGFAFSFFVIGNNELRAILVRARMLIAPRRRRLTLARRSRWAHARAVSSTSERSGAGGPGRALMCPLACRPRPTVPMTQLKHLVSPAGSGQRLAAAYLKGETVQPKRQSVRGVARSSSL